MLHWLGDLLKKVLVNVITIGLILLAIYFVLRKIGVL